MRIGRVEFGGWSASCGGATPTEFGVPPAEGLRQRSSELKQTALEERHLGAWLVG
jgi:hypothetical protein